MKKRTKIIILIINTVLLITFSVALILYLRKDKELPAADYSKMEKLTGEMETITGFLSSTESTEEKTEELLTEVKTGTEETSEAVTELVTEPTTEPATEPSTEYVFSQTEFESWPEVEKTEHQPGEITVGKQEKNRVILSKPICCDYTGKYPGGAEQAWKDYVDVGKSIIKKAFTYDGNKQEYEKMLNSQWYQPDDPRKLTYDDYDALDREVIVNIMSVEHAKCTPIDVVFSSCEIGVVGKQGTVFGVELKGYVKADFTCDCITETPSYTFVTLTLVDDKKNGTLQIIGLNFQYTYKKFNYFFVEEGSKHKVKFSVDDKLKVWDYSTYQNSFLENEAAVAAKKEFEEAATAH